MVDAEDQHPGHRGSRGQDHHGRVVNTWTPQLYRLFGIINSNLLSVFDPSREAPELKDSDNMDIFLQLNCFALFGCYQKYRKIKGEDLHDSHEEDRHVKHGGDAQGDLLPGLGRDEEHEPVIEPVEFLFYLMNGFSKAPGRSYISRHCNLVLCQIRTSERCNLLTLSQFV